MDEFEIKVKDGITVNEFINLLKSIPEQYKDKEIILSQDYWHSIYNIEYNKNANAVLIG